MELKRDSAGLGLSIVGGSDTPLVRGANKDATAKNIKFYNFIFILLDPSLIIALPCHSFTR